MDLAVRLGLLVLRAVQTVWFLLTRCKSFGSRLLPMHQNLDAPQEGRFPSSPGRVAISFTAQPSTSFAMTLWMPMIGSRTARACRNLRNVRMISAEHLAVQCSR